MKRERSRFARVEFITILVLLSVLTAVPAALASAGRKDGHGLRNKISDMQVPFIQNKGQISAQGVRYYAKTLGGTLSVTGKGELVYSFPGQRNGSGPAGWVIKERLLGAQRGIIEGREPAAAAVNVFTGSKASSWRTSISSYNAISLGRVYDGVGLALRAYGNNVEKVFVVDPGARPENIRLAVDGSGGITVNDQGQLVVATGLGPVTFTRPVAYQEADGKRMPVAVAYAARGNTYGFSVGSYDTTKKLVIDPLLASTFIGGTQDEEAFSVAMANGSVYVTGIAVSPDFPVTPGAYNISHDSSWDVFVSKFDADLQELQASTFLGGHSYDEAYGITVDSSGNVYIVGKTQSPDFPVTADAFDRSKGTSWDVFVAKLDGNLQTLLASTYLGGSSYDSEAAAIVTDAAGNVYVGGKTQSSDFPVTSGCYDSSSHGSWDGFVAKLDGNLHALLASTFLGGGNPDEVSSLAISSAGFIYAAGKTQSQDFPVVAGSYDTVKDTSWDVFVSKLDGNLQNLLASTFLGGNGRDEEVRSVSIDPAGKVHVAGTTFSTDFPVTAGAYDTTPAITADTPDAYLTKLDENLQNVLASTFLGGSGRDEIRSVVVVGGNIVATGMTESADFPMTPDAQSSTIAGSGDAFLVQFDSGLERLIYSTFLGGSGSDIGHCVAADGNGNFAVAGMAESPSFPVSAGVYDTTHNGGKDVFVLAFALTTAPDLSMTAVSGPTSGYTGQWITVYDTVGASSSGGAASAFNVALYLSPDPIITDSDVYLGMRQAGGLAPGASSSAATGLRIPANVSPGTYYIGAIADNFYVPCFECDPTGYLIAESDENNNALAGNQITVTAGSDLTITEVSGPATGLTGQTFTVRNTVKENGNGAYLVRVGIYLSQDEVITASDVRIGFRVLSLAAGQSSTADTTVTIPAVLAGGVYHIGAIADYSNSITEYDESNNALKGNPITITGSDMVMTTVSTQSSIPVMGTITVSNTVCTTGGASGPFYVGIYLSPDAETTTSDRLIKERYVSGLAAGQCSSENTAIAIPWNVAPGSYFIGAIADYNNIRPEESDNGNNALTGNPIEITPSLIDLAMISVAGPETGVIGGTIGVDSTVTNAGTQPSPTFVIYFYLNNVNVGYRIVAGLAPGASDTANTTLTIPTDAFCYNELDCDPFLPGTYNIIATADPGNSMAESNESNNSATSPNPIVVTQ